MAEVRETMPNTDTPRIAPASARRAMVLCNRQAPRRALSRAESASPRDEKQTYRQMDPDYLHIPKPLSRLFVRQPFNDTEACDALTYG